VGHGVLLAQVLEQRRQRRQAMPYGHAAQGALHQVVAPSDNVRASHAAKFLGLHDAGELHEIPEGVFVGPAGGLVAEVGEPFDFGGNVGQALELLGGQEPGSNGREDGEGACVAHGEVVQSFDKITAGHRWLLTSMAS